MSVINTNVKSLVAQNAMVKNERSMTTAMTQLSTGSRINSAKDDAAGQAISQKMTAQIRGLNQAVRNGNDGISLLQTAEGAMVEVTNMLQRMRELAVQSATDTNTADDRSYADSEFQQLKNEINRIATNTQWNGMNILNGNSALGSASSANGGADRTVKFQVGANADQTIDVDFKNLTFTTAATPATPRTIQIELGGMTQGTDVARFNATMGGVTVDFGISSFSGAGSATNASTMATQLQAGIQAYSGLNNVTVTATGSTITITDPSGATATGASLKNATGSATVAVPTVTTSTGSAATGAAPTGGLFNTANGGARIDSLAVDTRTNSNSAITALDTALKSVNNARSTLGSVMNRLTYAVDNLANVSQNATESRSRVLDTDYAQTTTQLARSQIIAQAATAMLAQANQAPQSVLALLK